MGMSPLYAERTKQVVSLGSAKAENLGVPLANWSLCAKNRTTIVILFDVTS